MRITSTRSHFNGLEYLLVHHGEAWRELVSVLETAPRRERSRARRDAPIDALGWTAVQTARPGIFQKAGIWFDVSGPFRAAELADHFARLIARYRNGDFDVCILPFPAEARSGMAKLADALTVLARDGRHAFPVPLVLLEIKRDRPAAAKPKPEGRKAAGAAAAEATIR